MSLSDVKSAHSSPLAWVWELGRKGVTGLGNRANGVSLRAGSSWERLSSLGQGSRLKETGPAGQDRACGDGVNKCTVSPLPAHLYWHSSHWHPVLRALPLGTTGLPRHARVRSSIPNSDNID